MNQRKKVPKKYSQGKYQKTKLKRLTADDERSEGKFSDGKLAKSDYNDVSWYTKNDAMLRDAASFSYNQPLGTAVRTYHNVFDIAGEWQEVSGQTQGAASSSVPGIMTLVTGIGPGLSTQYNSPINLAAQNIYSYVRYMNSGAANYETADLMLYLLAMDSAYACWNHLKRIYGLACQYSQYNWYMPRVCLQGLGVDVEDLLSNLSDFRLFLNTAAARLTSFCVPGTMSLMIRHSWMFSNLWKDSDTNKAQMYQFTPLYFYMYSETTSTQGGELVAKPWTSWSDDSPNYVNHRKPVLLTTQQMEDYLMEMINLLQKSEDIGIMSGDILKAYGNDKLFKLSPVDADYKVDPVYNEEVLNQIHNATVLHNSFLGSILATNAFTITQEVNTQTLIWNPVFQTGARVSKPGTIMNMPWSEVTPANTMVGSRLACTYVITPDSDDKPQSSNFSFSSVGTEFIWNAYMGFMSYETASNSNGKVKWYGVKTLYEVRIINDISQGQIVDPNTRYTYNDVSSLRHRIALQVHNDVTTLSLASQFDWGPLIIPVVDDWDDALVQGSGLNMEIGIMACAVHGDMNTWTLIHGDELENMHLTAIMSEFNIPVLGSF